MKEVSIMYETKIPGTKYTIALVNIKGQWMMQIKLFDNIEAENPVKDISEHGIRGNVKSLINEVNLIINDFLIEQIIKDITEQAHILFREVEATVTRETKQSVQTEMSAVEETLIQIVKKMESLEKRIKRIEDILQG
jgi:hypothetical protein